MLMRCLDALKAQSYHDFEVIVVDDGSTDGTPNALAERAQYRASPRLQWFRNGRQSGANYSRNRAIRESRAEFIAFLDDDCITDPDWLANLMAGFDSDRVAAVTGLVRDPQPRTLFDVAFKGVNRVHGQVRPGRLVSGNLCVRRQPLLQCMFDEDPADVDPDVSMSGRCDEEGIFLRLKAAGQEMRVAYGAVVTHEHYYTARSFFKQAYKGGQATAKLVYQYRLPPRLDLTPLFLFYLTLPLAFVGRWSAVFPLSCAAFFLLAITYNDLFRRRKTLWETTITFPIQLAYYHLRLAGYLTQRLRLLTGRDRLERFTFSH